MRCYTLFLKGEKMAKRKKWIKPRHRVIKAIAKAVLWPVCKLKYGIEIEKSKGKVPPAMSSLSAEEQMKQYRRLRCNTHSEY